MPVMSGEELTSPESHVQIQNSIEKFIFQIGPELIKAFNDALINSIQMELIDAHHSTDWG